MKRLTVLVLVLALLASGLLPTSNVEAQDASGVRPNPSGDFIPGDSSSVRPMGAPAAPTATPMLTLATPTATPVNQTRQSAGDVQQTQVNAQEVTTSGISDSRCYTTPSAAATALSGGWGTWTKLEPVTGRSYIAWKFTSDQNKPVTLTWPGWGSFNHFSEPGDIRRNITGATSGTFNCEPERPPVPSGFLCPASPQQAADVMTNGWGSWKDLGYGNRTYRKWQFTSNNNEPVTLWYPGVGSFDHWKYGTGYKGDIEDATSATFNCEPDGLAPTPTATPSLCTPKPPVTLAVSQQQDFLLVTISAIDNRADMDNKLKRVDPSSNRATNNFTFEFPTGPGIVKDGNGVKFTEVINTYQFRVIRRGAGAITAPFVVTTDCGQWPTFAGGGAGVAPGIRPTATPVPAVQYPPLDDGEQNTDPRCPGNSKVARDMLSQGHGTWTVLPANGRGYRAIKFVSDGGEKVTLTYPGWGAFNHHSASGDIRRNIPDADSGTFLCKP